MRTHQQPHLRTPRRRSVRLAALVAVVAVFGAACEGSRDDEKASTTTAPSGSSTTGGGTAPIVDTSACTSSLTTGIDGDTIKLGTSLPQSGLYSAFAEILHGSEAYFEYLNEELGGVEIAGKKYKIELTASDDQYQAEKTVQNVNKLITDDKVFALFNVVGTKNNLAIRELVNDQCVPNLFAATGSPAWGNPEFPWLLGTELVPYPLEVKAFVDYLKENKPDAKVAILRADDDFGRAYADTFASLTDGTGITLAKEETYNPEQFDTKAQVTSLAATDADALLLGATLLGCPDALRNVAAAGWKPLIYMSGTCTSKTLMSAAGDAGDKVLSVAPLLDPADPANDSNENVKLYKEKVGKYAPADTDATNGIVAYGWTTAALLTNLLSGLDTLDRGAVINAARTITDVQGIGLMLPGQSFNTNADDWFLGETFNLVQYDKAKGFFAAVGDTIDLDGQTADFTPSELING